LTKTSQPFPKPGSRIAVIGATGSGKTTLTQQLGILLNLNVIELDALHWMQGWTEAPWEEMRARLDALTCQDHWITDGNYGQVRDLIWPRADTIIWLDYPLLMVFVRLFIRTIQRVFLKIELWNGNRERFKDNFFSRDSLFLWLISTHLQHKKKYPIALQEPQHAHLQVIRFKHPRQTALWIESLHESVINHQDGKKLVKFS
jgi:energy-coupling factor transporter ATP-binding protein EcfA2